MDYEKYYQDLKKAERLEFIDNKHDEAISLLLPYRKEIDEELETISNPRFFKRPFDKDSYMINANEEKTMAEESDDNTEESHDESYPLDITELENDYFTFYFILGVAYFNLGSIQNSSDCLYNAGLLNRSDSYTANYIAQCSISESNMEDAFVCFHAAINNAINPVELSFAYETAACFFMKEKDPKAALAALVFAYINLPKPEYMEFIKVITGEDVPDEKYFSSEFIDDALQGYFLDSSISPESFDKLKICAYFANQEGDREALCYYLSFLAALDKKYEKKLKDVKAGKKVKIPAPFYSIDKIYYREITERNKRLYR